ncbi:hypothetical protein [Psychroserpens luteolus]|uniref:hypothetical protein n=1 Tax=Psychroserpens luteolus TaxID=2855840 RepID=UPI001E4C6D97|nr:hypothetical protein [Psychroserpens luteolus]MCD2259771.1 hypothetical protein [Psychroserpens luteolus]
MKKFIILLLLSLSFNSVTADCTSKGMYFFPDTREISLNSMFIIQGYAFSQKTINGFKERTIYLESEHGELIELHLQDILKGQMQLTQAIFCPVSELKPNTTYVLKYTDQTNSEGAEMMKYNRKKKKREKVYWTTTGNTSSTPLHSNLTLEFKTSEVAYYGCGPSAYAIFKIKNMPESEVWFKTEVIEISTNTSTTFYLIGREDQLYIGHGMCSGAFRFNGKGKYKVRFTPMNIDGKSLTTTAWKPFESPFATAKSPFGN